MFSHGIYELVPNRVSVWLPQEAQTFLFRYHWNFGDRSRADFTVETPFPSPTLRQLLPGRSEGSLQGSGKKLLHLFRGLIPSTSPFLQHFSQAPDHSNIGLNASDIWYLWLPFPSHLPGISFFWWNSFKIAKADKISLKSQQSSAVAVTWNFIGQIKKTGCVWEYHITDQSSFQWNTSWHQLMWDLLLHGVVTLKFLCFHQLGLFLGFYCFIWGLLGKEEAFQEMSSCIMCCTDVSWGNRHQEQEKPEDEWTSESKIGNSLKFLLWGKHKAHSSAMAQFHLWHRERTLPSCWWTDTAHIHATILGIQACKGAALKQWQLWLVSCPHDLCVPEKCHMEICMTCAPGWISFPVRCVSPCLTPVGIKANLCHWSADLAWMMQCSFIHTLIWGPCLIKPSPGFISQMYLGFFVFSCCLAGMCTHLLVHSRVHRILWGFFSGTLRVGQKFVVPS